MSEPEWQSPSLDKLYQYYLTDEDSAAFIRAVSQRYTVSTLQRLAESGRRISRRAAVVALGFVGDYGCNSILGTALLDDDRGVRVIAENGIRNLWYRGGTDSQNKQLRIIIRLNTCEQYELAIELADELIEEAPAFAEAWNQRAIAYYHLEHFHKSAEDCKQTLEFNPYHFAGIVGMAHCYLELNDGFAALECFRRALKLNPDMEGVRAQVEYLQRTLEGK